MTELVTITFATQNSTYRFQYVRGHEFGLLEGVVGTHGGERFTVHIEEIRDLVHKGDSPTLNVKKFCGPDGTLTVTEITDVTTRVIWAREPDTRIQVNI